MRLPEDHITASPEFHLARDLNHEGPPSATPSTPGEAKAEAAEVGAAAPPTDVDTTGSWYAPDPSLPIIELPHATGPGADDPFGIMPPDLALGYDRPLTLLDQLIAGDPNGGRTFIALDFGSDFFRDLYLATADNLIVVTLRPRISDFSLPDPREQARGRLLASGVMMIGALITPGPQDDIALGAGATGYAARGGRTVRLRHYTNTKGIEGIEGSGTLRARDQGRVFFDTTSGKPLSPRDAEAKFGLKPGRGRHIVETDVAADRVTRVWNKVLKVYEYQIVGDVPLSNPTFIRR
jgi:hypothetical protein